MARWKNSLNTADEISQIKRMAVLREAGRIFSKRGYHNTSLDDIALALNVSKGTLYNYVKDKQEILYSCHKMALDIGELAIEAIKAKSSDPLRQLTMLIETYITALFDEFGVCGVITEIDALRSADREKVVMRRNVYERQVRQMIQRAIDCGSVRSLDPHLVAQIMTGALNSVSLWYDPEGRLSSKEIARLTTDFFLDGLRSRPESS